MGFWGSIEETVVDGSAGAVGCIPEVGEAAATAIHGVDAAAHGAAGLYDQYVAGDKDAANNEYATAATQGVEAVGSAIPHAGQVMAGADLVMAADAGLASTGLVDGLKAPQDMINQGVNAATGSHLDTDSTGSEVGLGTKIAGAIGATSPVGMMADAAYGVASLFGAGDSKSGG